MADKAGNFTLRGASASLDLAGRKVAVTHYPTIAQGMAASGLYDLVCCGHDHTREIKRVGKCLKVNPGEVMGRFGVSSYAVYDTETGKAEIVEV